MFGPSFTTNPCPLRGFPPVAYSRRTGPADLLCPTAIGPLWAAHRDEDLYQQALYVVLKGIAGQGGRNPGHEDVKTKDTFRNYIRGVINSIAEGWARTHHRNGHCSLDLIQDIVAAKEAAQVEYQDLIAQLFTRLRQRASPPAADHRRLGAVAGRAHPMRDHTQARLRREALSPANCHRPWTGA